MSKLQHDFTQGPIGRELVSFCIPFLLSNVLQALYGAVDMWVVGNFPRRTRRPARPFFRA